VVPRGILADVPDVIVTWIDDKRFDAATTLNGNGQFVGALVDLDSLNRFIDERFTDWLAHKVELGLGRAIVAVTRRLL
jgi:hypothetical protein